MLKIPVLVAMLVLTACSAHRLAAPELVSLKLLPPAEISDAVMLKQKITLQAEGGQRQFLAVARFDSDRLKLVVLLPTGQRLLSLEYDGQKLVQEVPHPASRIPHPALHAAMKLWFRR